MDLTTRYLGLTLKCPLVAGAGPLTTQKLLSFADLVLALSILLVDANTLYFHCFGNMKTSYAVDALAALAQGTRLNIFRLLVQHAPNGLPAGTIARRLQLPGPTLSFHLNVFAAADLVEAHKNGRSISYSANLKSVSLLKDFLTEDCCGGRGGCGLIPKPPRDSSAKKYSHTHVGHEHKSGRR